MAETVLIEFQIDDSQLVSALERLEKAGAIDSKMAGSFKQTTAEINKQSAEIKKAATATTPLKKNLEDVNKATKQFTKDFMTGFNEGVIETLKEAGVSVEQFTDALSTGITNAEEPTESLRQRLKNLTVQIAELKLRGEDNTEQFKELVIEAGNIKDAIGDAAAEIKNAGSDTRTFDNLLGAAQAVAGGFAVAQGAAALFGDESEELQETLVKVNAAMAILQGLQTVSNALQQEGAIIQLFSNKQRIIANAQLAVENGLQSTSIIVRTGAAVAQRALNAAMAANPILLLISALVLVVTAMASYIKSSKEAEIQTGELNAAVEEATEGFENYARQVKLKSDEATSELEKNGALQSKILEGQLKSEQDIDARRRLEIARLRQFLTTSRNAEQKDIAAAEDRLKQLAQDSSEAFVKIKIQENALARQLREENLKDQIAAAETALLEADEGSKRQLQIQKQLIGLRAQQELNAAGLTESEKTKIAANAIKEREELDAAASKREIDLQLKTIDTKLINVKEGSEEELKLKQQQIELQTQSELTSTKLSEKEKEQIKKEGLEKQIKLQTDYNTRVEREAIEAQISRNNAEISLLETSNQNRLILQIANIELAAAAEVNAANGNAAKIKEINAKRDADILAVRKQFIDDALQYELEIAAAKGGALRRANEKIAADESKSLDKRLAAVNQLAAKEIEGINKRQDALKQQFDEGLITREEFELKNEELRDKELEAEEKAAEKKKQLIKEVEQARIQFAAQAATEVLNIISQFGQQQTEAEQIRIDGQRQEIEELLEAGAITEREAAARQKRLDKEEASIKRRQAERDRAVAIFQAVINTAAGIAKAIPNIALMALAAAVGAAQVALIASRPLPRFGHGKKSGYEGPAEIGETGPELYEQSGRMFLADKKQLVWLAAKDRVYNPTETKEMLMPVVDKQIMQWQPPAQKSADIDYDKLGKAVGKHINIPGFNIDEQGFKIWEQKGNERKIYMDKRYSSK